MSTGRRVAPPVLDDDDYFVEVKASKHAHDSNTDMFCHRQDSECELLVQIKTLFDFELTHIFNVAPARDAFGHPCAPLCGVCLGPID